MKFEKLLKLGLVGLAVYIALGSQWFSALNSISGWDIFVGALVVQPIVLICLVVLAMRYILLIGAAKIGIVVAFRAIVLSQGLNLVLPARLSELLKATYLRDHASVPFSSGVSAVALERSVDVLIVGMLGALGVTQFFDRGNFASIAVIGLVLAIAIVVLVRSPNHVLRLVYTLSSERLARFLERTYLHFSTTAEARTFWYALLLGGVAWCLSYINVLVFLQLAGSIGVGISGALLVFILTTLGGAIPGLPGGLGTYEAGAVIALRSLGYSFDEALLLAFSMHAAQLILPFVMAVLIMLTDRTGISALLTDLRKTAATKDASCVENNNGDSTND